MHFQFFVFAWPGWAHAAEKLEMSLVDRGEDVHVIASGIPEAPERWLSLTDDAYFGEQFVTALRNFKGDVLVHIQADASITDMDRFLHRLRTAYALCDPGVWAPDVDYTFYRTELVIAPSGFTSGKANNLDPAVVEVLNTDCTCWSLNSVVASALKDYAREDWNLGWGWDTLASAISWSMGLQVLRDLSVQVQHPRGTGYNAQVAEREFDRVRESLPSGVKQLVSLQESLILERYQHSRQWLKDRLRSRWK